MYSDCYFLCLLIILLTTISLKITACRLVWLRAKFPMHKAASHMGEAVNRSVPLVWANAIATERESYYLGICAMTGTGKEKAKTGSLM